MSTTKGYFSDFRCWVFNRHAYQFSLFNMNSIEHLVVVECFFFRCCFLYPKEIYWFSFRDIFVIHAVAQYAMVVLERRHWLWTVVIIAVVQIYTRLLAYIQTLSNETKRNEPRVNLCTAYIAFEFNEMALLSFLFQSNI